MDQEIINLINFFIQNKRLSREDRRRFTRLLARDASVAGNSKIDFEDSESKVYIHSPKKMIEFLSLFSKDDRFKWFTHKWDMREPFKIDEFISELKKNKIILQNMAYVAGPVVNQKTYNQVWNFINFDNFEFTWKNTNFDNIPYGWHSVAKLSKKNPEKSVENLLLDNGHQFKDYIRMFKSTIEFRTDLKDDDRFSELIWRNIKAGLPKDFKIEFSEEFDDIGYDVNVYCDVIAVIAAIRQICNWIVQFKSRSSEVSIDLNNEESWYRLTIFHHNSHFTNLEKLENPSGDLASLRDDLFSVCDYSMTGDLKKEGRLHGAIKATVLDSETYKNGKVMSPCKIDWFDNKVGGVKYEFKIYKGI